MHKKTLADLMVEAQTASRTQYHRAWFRRDYRTKEGLLEEALRDHRDSLWVSNEPKTRGLLTIIGPSHKLGVPVVLHIPMRVVRKRHWGKLIGEFDSEMKPE